MIENRPRNGYFRNQQGISIIEVLIAAGLLAIAGVGLMTFSSNVAKLQYTNKLTEDFGNVVQNVGQIVVSETSCRLALGGPPTLGSGPTANAQAMALDGNATNIKIYQSNAVSQTVYMDPSDPNHNQFNNWKLTSLTIQPILLPATPPGPIPSYITVTMTSGSVISRKVTNLYLSVMLDPGTNNINSCFGLTMATDGNPVPVCPTGSALLSSGTHVGCRKIICTSGTPNGFDAIGNVICL